MNKLILSLFVSIFLLLGCAQTSVSPELTPVTLSAPSTGQTIDWIWDRQTIAVSADLTEAESVPLRNESLHLNVNMFVEGPPCPKCLKVGKPKLLDDGTFTIEVTLRHPFPNQPEYTGFDVRGIVVFKATDYCYTTNYMILPSYGSASLPLMAPVLLYYSEQSKGGAAL